MPEPSAICQKSSLRQFHIHPFSKQRLAAFSVSCLYHGLLHIITSPGSPFVGQRKKRTPLRQFSQLNKKMEGVGVGGTSTNMDCSRMQCVCSSLHISPALCLEHRRTPRFVKHEHTMWNAQGRSLTNGPHPHEMMSGAWLVRTSLPFVGRRWQSERLSVSETVTYNCGRDSRQNGRLKMEAWDECCSQ